MRWIKQLYMGESAERKKDRIIRGIRESRILLDVYVFTLPENPEDQLDIIPSNWLRQTHYKNREELTIIGFARGWEEVECMLLALVTDAMKALGTPDLRAYLKLLLTEKEDVDD